MNQIKTILIIAGGSGGHVFPGLSIAQYLINHGYKVVWLGCKNNIESELVPMYGIDIKFICIQGLCGKKIYEKLVVLFFYIFLSMYQSFKIIRCWKPDIVLSMGGYVAGPGSLVAWFCGIPLIIHEQNRIMGLTNQFLSFFANIILQGFPDSISNAITSGNPVRHTFLSISDPIIRWKNRTGLIRVLVMGGSKGAHIFNEIIPRIYERLSNKLMIWHQSGKQDFEYVVEAYRKSKSNNYKVMSFISNVKEAYEWADIIISRSGALTVSEITCVGLPAIFVPFDYHKDKQQYWNAMSLVEIGAAIIIEQEKFTIDYVSMILNTWNRTMFLDMAQRSKKLVRPNSTQIIEQVINQCLNKK